MDHGHKVQQQDLHTCIFTQVSPGGEGMGHRKSTYALSGQCTKRECCASIRCGQGKARMDVDADAERCVCRSLMGGDEITAAQYLWCCSRANEAAPVANHQQLSAPVHGLIKQVVCTAVAGDLHGRNQKQERISRPGMAGAAAGHNESDLVPGGQATWQVYVYAAAAAALTPCIGAASLSTSSR